MSVSKIVPNPFDKDSKLSELVKKGELIKEGLSFTTIIKNIVFLIIIGIILVAYFKISLNIVGILIGIEVLLTLIGGYIRIRKIKSVYAIETQDNARSYRKILITSEYYDLIKTIFAVVANGIGIAIIFFFFSNEISNFVVQNIPLSIPIKLGALKYLILVFVIFRFFEFIMRLVRYNWIKNLRENDDLAQVNQEYTLIGKKLELIRFIPAMSIFLLILFLIDIPSYMILLFAGFMLFMILLSIIELKRIKKIKFDNEGIDKSVIQHKIENYKSEKIAGSVFGITKTAASFKDFFKVYGSSTLGSGKSYYPENTLLVTNYRLLFIQVPISGGNKIVGEVNYVEENFFFNRGELRKKGEQILKTNSISQISKLATNDVLYKDIKKLTLKQTKIIIEKLTGEKIGYFFMDREYIDLLKQLFKFYLKDKFIEK